ncbi:hypothetical protein [Streptomyces sp. NBC_00827]|uniref:hypothetical protein n=1 Tax=Streptomyces sp. NBC_00827 TaxID=2903677 RepID=UPI003869D761|nr:hypothetical protein OG569_42620 [Streptomyces sp. NBC_00827]
MTALRRDHVMGTCGFLATHIDLFMLGARVFPEWERLDAHAKADASCLNGRLLVHYLVPGAQHDFREGFAGGEGGLWATPTPYSSDDAARYLRFPCPQVARTHAILIDPTKVPELRGPRRVQRGDGLEFLLPQGVPANAILDQTEVEVR